MHGPAGWRTWNHDSEMSAADTAAGLSGFAHRVAGSDAERRAADWLAGQIQSGTREAELERFWCRPNWALANVWHILLGIAGSLVSVSSPRVGGALLLASLVLVVLDGLTGRSPARWLTRERASQNVISEAAGASRIRLIVTANYDAGRTGLVHRTLARRSAAGLRRLTGGVDPGWSGWLAIALVWLIATAVARDRGAAGAVIGAAQLIPTAGLVLAAALLIELAGATAGPSAGDNASGAAVAIALVRALDVAPPQRLAVELVLQGASDGTMLGLRRHLRARRAEITPGNAIVLGIAPCGAGAPRWWVSDGPLLPLRFDRRTGQLLAGVAASEAHLGATPRRGRGTTPALPARAAGIRAVSIGCLDDRGLHPLSHQAGDTPDHLDPAALDATLELALALVDELDADLAGRSTQAGTPTPTAT
jgi:Peptidase family M28